METLDELKILLNDVYNIYLNVCDDWAKYVHNIYNQSKFTVNHIVSDSKNMDKLLNIYVYRDFLNNEETENIFKLSKLDNVSHFRVKQFNSIIYKLATYFNKQINGSPGSMAINKCLNDILGLRIITKTNFDFNIVKNFISENFPTFKCIDSSKEKYKAIHIYIKKNNMFYLWEVQLWYINDQKQNDESHNKHKQAYTKWEKMFKEKKGGLK